MSAHLGSLNFAQLSYNSSQPPRASFDDDRDLDELARLRKLSMLTVDSNNFNNFGSRKNSKNVEDDGVIEDEGDLHGVDILNVDGEEGGFEDYDDEDEVEVEKRWFAFEVADCPPSLKFLVRFFR